MFQETTEVHFYILFKFDFHKYESALSYFVCIVWFWMSFICVWFFHALSGSIIGKMADN